MTVQEAPSTSGRHQVPSRERHHAPSAKAGRRRAKQSWHAHAGQNGALQLDLSINPAVAQVQVSKTMALTDLARDLKRQGVDVVSLTSGEPDFDTPAAITEAGIQALR